MPVEKSDWQKQQEEKVRDQIEHLPPSPPPGKFAGGDIAGSGYPAFHQAPSESGPASRSRRAHVATEASAADGFGLEMNGRGSIADGFGL